MKDANKKNENEQKLKTGRTFTGVVVSVAMNKTITVKVESTKKHPKYEKRFLQTRKFLVHDEKGTFVVGDEVTFVECRPLSKRKRWKVIYNQ
ncbi:MAG TPA: 30S ribosomal protein S17 [Patescibacteria group bacterium]|nr:30S ribosomal protein S17 [Patescibacteria group bacterium]